MPLMLHTSSFRNDYFSPTPSPTPQKKEREKKKKARDCESVPPFLLSYVCSEVSLVHVRLSSLHYTVVFNPLCLSKSAAAAAKSLQSCPTLCDPRDSSPPGCLFPGILQAITLEWVAISFSNAWKWKVKVTSLSHVRLLATPWTAAYQAPPSMGFS